MGWLKSSLCTKAALESPAFLNWADRMRPAWDRAGSGKRINLHRKLWEWCFIAQALHERGFLAPGLAGLGFGVGREPQSALMASLGCRIVATDLAPFGAGAQHWMGAGQHAVSLGDLNPDGLCPADAFAGNVVFRPVDMNRIPADLRGFDFTWSSCAFEHLGSIWNGLRFILRQMDCLRPGGVAVHTTEFNLSSRLRTVDWKETVLFRRRDIELLAATLRSLGHSIELDWSLGESPEDRHVDVPPFSDVHLRLLIGRYTATSLGLIITKAASEDRQLPRTIRLRRTLARLGSEQRRGMAFVEGQARAVRARIRRSVERAR